MKVYLASDHAGFDLKESIKKYLIEKGMDVVDFGAFEKNPDDDYPDFISLAANEVSKDPKSFGIVFGKSGAGECIVANKIKNVRAVVGFNTDNVGLSRLDNDANVLCLGSNFVDLETAKRLVDTFLETRFSNEERHIRRINKISAIENRSSLRSD